MLSLFSPRLSYHGQANASLELISYVFLSNQSSSEGENREPRTEKLKSQEKPVWFFKSPSKSSSRCLYLCLQAFLLTNQLCFPTGKPLDLKMRLIIRDNSLSASAYVASYIVERIKTFNPTPENPFVLGLPTGSSPLGVYRILVEKYKAGEVTFENVVTFNMVRSPTWVLLPADLSRTSTLASRVTTQKATTPLCGNTSLAMSTSTQATFTSSTAMHPTPRLSVSPTRQRFGVLVASTCSWPA